MVSTDLGEIAKHFRHLVTALTTADVDDDVGVGVLGEGLGNHSLAAAEGAGNGSRTTLHAPSTTVRSHAINFQESYQTERGHPARVGQ